jgi:hypothetical protein
MRAHGRVSINTRAAAHRVGRRAAEPHAEDACSFNERASSVFQVPISQRSMLAEREHGSLLLPADRQRALQQTLLDGETCRGRRGAGV